MITNSTPPRKNLVVIGNGMVGHRFVEKMVEFDAARQYRSSPFAKSRGRRTTGWDSPPSSPIATQKS
jgi:hypothetical protein